MTTIDKTGASDAEFRARVAAFDAAPTPPECDPERVETVARALWNTLPATETGWRGADPSSRQTWLRLATAAIAADPSPAEEAVRWATAEEVASRYFDRGDDEWEQLRTDVAEAMAGNLRAALASPAPAPQGGGQR